MAHSSRERESTMVGRRGIRLQEQEAEITYLVTIRKQTNRNGARIETLKGHPH